MAAAIDLPAYCCEHLTKGILKTLKKQIVAPSSSTYFTSQYGCLQCSTSGSFRDLDNHFINSGHSFASSSRSQSQVQSLYCGTCKDLVYSLQAVEASSKKRKLAAYYDEDETFITTNIAARPCGREGVRGLFNLGETCYMNAVLQMMVHNRLLAGYFLGMGHPLHTCPISNQSDKKGEDEDDDDEDGEEVKIESKPCIACAFTEIFAESRMADQTTPAQAVNLLYASWKSIETMAGKGQCDSQEWFIEIVDRLHESTKVANSGSVNGNVHSTHAADSDPCTCFFHKTFYGITRSCVTCSICNTLSSASEAFSSLSLDFKKQAKRKRKALSDSATSPTNGSAQTPIPSIQECLSAYTSSEPLSAEGYHCHGCGTPRSASKQLRIRKLPAILCIHIKRFGIKASSPFTEEKYEGKIDFPLQLDMHPYTTLATQGAAGEEVVVKEENGDGKGEGQSQGATEKRLMYDLESVIVHQGEQISNGHYYSFCRQDERWFRFDDEIVSATTVEDVLRQDAYLLFYTARGLGGESEI